MTDIITLPQITAEDVVITPACTQAVYSRLMRMHQASSSRLSTYGKTVLPSLSNLHSLNVEDQNNAESIKALSVVMPRLWEFAEYISRTPEVIAEALNNRETLLNVKYRGLHVQDWSIADESWAQVTQQAVDKLIDKFAVELTPEQVEAENFGTYPTYRFFVLNQDKFNDSYLYNPSEPWLSRAVYLAKRRAVMQTLDTLNTRTASSEQFKGMPMFYFETTSGAVPQRMYRNIANTISRVSQVKVSSADIADARNALLTTQTNSVSQDSYVRKQLSQEKFLAHWSNIKQSKQRLVDTATMAELQEQWATIPIAEQYTRTERTWGIEVETVRANMTTRPNGWDAHSDGSLESDDGGGCDCDCTSCYDGEHCERSSRDCEYGDDGCMEFVSPILSHFNSEGLRRLCRDIPTHESNTTPGIHVHVGAGDLTVTDVARLLYAYGVVERFLVPLYHRETTGYCKETPSNSVQWWLSAARRHLRDTGSVPRPKDICYEQPSDRYMDVNTQALRGHGTIEFRAMGPYYDYEHLVRWAWFVRQMVVVSRLDLPQQVWNACTSLTDVIDLLRKYGNESVSTPSDSDTANANYEE